MGEGLLSLAALGSIGIFFILVGIVFYVLKSIGLVTLAANKGIENAWLGWIPLADLYIAGVIVEDMELFGIHVDNLGLWVPVVFVGGIILGGIPVIGWILDLAVFIFAIFFVYRLFGIYTENAVLFTVLSVLLGLFPIFIFVIRNNPSIGNPPQAF